MCSCNLTIGIIDSSPLIRAGITRLLLKMGFTVVAASEIDGYLEKVNEQQVKPKVCIVNIDKPDITAFALARNIKARYTDTILLAYSAYQDHQLSLNRLHDYGVDVFLEKSFSPEKVRMLIYAAWVKADRVLLN